MIVIYTRIISINNEHAYAICARIYIYIILYISHTHVRVRKIFEWAYERT